MKLLLTGAYAWTKDQLNYFEDLGYQIILVPDEREPAGFNAADIEIVVCNNLFRYAEISEFKNLKFIQLTSAGTDTIPYEYIVKKGIRLENARGVYSIPIAEWVVLKILELVKKSRYFYTVQKQHQWLKERNLGELSGKSAVIVGYGSIGIETAKRLQAFDVKITAVDIRQPGPEEMQWIYALQPPSNLDDVLSQSDIVILTIPLTAHTHHLINRNRLKIMKDSAVLVNVARGAIIDEQALIAELNNKRFAGVALDVFDDEPLPVNNPLWDYGNVVVTPHNAFISDQNHRRLFNCILRNLEKHTKPNQREVSADIT